MSLYIKLQDTEWEITEKLLHTEQREIRYLSRRIFCFEIFVAGFIQDLLLIRTNRYSSIHFFQALASKIQRFPSRARDIFHFYTDPYCLASLQSLQEVWKVFLRRPVPTSGAFLCSDFCVSDIF
jgi:hypothetical protein